MRRTALVAAVIALGLAACSRGGLPPEQVQAWVGKPAGDLVRAWGAPTREVEDAGQRVMIYEEVERNQTLAFEKTVSSRQAGSATAAEAANALRGADRVRPLVPLLGRRRRRDRQRPDPTALTGARPAGPALAAPGPRAIVAAHGPLAPARPTRRRPPDLDEITREVQAFGRGPSARLGGRLPRVPPAALPGHAPAPAAGRRAPPPRRRLVPGPSLRPRSGPRLGGRSGSTTRSRAPGPGPTSSSDAASARSRSAAARSSASRSPLPTASVDAVLFCELFEHLHLNPFHTLKEIFRVLRPGGLFLLTTPNLRRVETLSRLWHGWGAQPPVSRDVPRALPLAALPPPQPRVHGERARLLPRAPGEGSLRLPPRSRVLLGRARRRARDPRGPRTARRPGRAAAGPPAPPRRAEPPRPAHRARLAARTPPWSNGTHLDARRGLRPGRGGRAAGPGIHPPPDVPFG